MTYSAKEIANYIDGNINLAPNSLYTIYEREGCGLCYTSGSWEYRDGEYKEVMTFKTSDEVPECVEDIEEILIFKLNI